MNKFPKLEDQDDYLMYLQNNNYSIQTIINYARDLCIFATFLHFRNTEFKNVSKKDINTFKGYLVAGEHLKDLDKFRVKSVRSAGISSINGSEAPRGSKQPLKNNEGVVAPSDETKDSVNGSGMFESEFLSNVYGKVYGSLGSIVHRENRGNNGLDSRSINRMLSSLRSFLKFRISWDLDIPLPPDAVELMKADKRIKKVASLDDLVSLIQSPMSFEKDEKVALRNRCMLEILFATGLRISELVSLNLEQINVEGKIFVVGKGKKERSVFLTPRSLDWLNKYLVVRLKYAFLDREDSEQPIEMESFFLGDEKHRETSGDSEKKSDLNLEIFDRGNRKYIELVETYRKSGLLKKFDSPALFIPFSGIRSRKPNARISTNYFQERIVIYRNKLGIQIPTSAHSLRHGFATYMAENGASPVALQVLLGHESLNTTTRYVHASEKFAEETVKKNHPLR